MDKKTAKSLSNVALLPEVQNALNMWMHSAAFRNSKSIGVKGMLIGELAMSLYTIPRPTNRIEVFYPEKPAIPGGVTGFTRHQKNVFQENFSKVEVWTHTPESLCVPKSVGEIIICSGFDRECRKRLGEIAANWPEIPLRPAYAILDGMTVASLECLIVLKLYSSTNKRFEAEALADIAYMLECNPQITMESSTGWSLSQFHLNKLKLLLKRK
jgi:hypothetical protein